MFSRDGDFSNMYRMFVSHFINAVEHKANVEVSEAGGVFEMEKLSNSRPGSMEMSAGNAGVMSRCRVRDSASINKRKTKQVSLTEVSQSRSNEIAARTAAHANPRVKMLEVGKSAAPPLLLYTTYIILCVFLCVIGNDRAFPI